MNDLYGSGDFFNEELSDLHMKDKRLIDRAKIIGNTFLKSPGSCIQEVFSCQNSARCAYDFFSNVKVNWNQLFCCHQEKTVNRIKQADNDYVYVLQDSSFYNYTKHKGKIDLEVIGKEGRFTQLGFIQHTALCLSSNDRPLGLLALDFVGYNNQGADIKPYSSKVTAYERWHRFFKLSEEKLKQTNKKMITLCDREADFFEFLVDVCHSEHYFVVRSKHNRYTGKSYRRREDRIHSHLNRSPVLGSMKINVCDPNTHEDSEQRFAIKAVEGLMIPPTYHGPHHQHKTLKPITLNVVEAYNKEHRWVLLTNLPVKTIKQVAFVIHAYKKRWHIESFFKVLKTAYKADQVYLHSFADAIKNLLALINIAAYKTYWTMHQARRDESTSALICFSLEEIQAVYVYCSKAPPAQGSIPSLKDMYYRVAKLGGYKNIKNKYPPGTLTLYRGMKKLHDITQMYKQCMSIKT